MLHKYAVIFTCASLLLLTAESSGAEKWCRIRNLPLYRRDMWNYFTGAFCYLYTNNYRLNFKYAINTTYIFPITEIDDTAYFTYDYTDNASLYYVRKSFKTEYFFQMWIDCCQEAADCCDNFQNDENIYPNQEYPCPATWDGWTCWAPAQAGTLSKMPCSKQAYSTESDVCELLSEKQCFPNGTWNQKTDTGVCAMAPVLRNRHTFNVITLAVATALAFPAVLVFFSLRVFRKNTRYIMHRNLITVIVLRNLLTIMTKQIIILDALKVDGNGVMAGNSVACRVLAFFENAAKNGMFACMLADGFYLHKLIVRAFANEPNLIYIYVAVLALSFVPSLAWAIARAAHNGTDCWMVDDTSDQWIVDGFRIAILAINFLLLLDIIRVMTIKLKRGNISQQAKSTLRATLFLIPLFGIHIVIITNRNMVTSNACEAQDIYFYVSYLIEGLQGVMVATLFCYINSEVRGELKNAFRKFALHLESRFGITLGKKENHRRRTTAATYVEPFSTRA